MWMGVVEDVVVEAAAYIYRASRAIQRVKGKAYAEGKEGAHTIRGNSLELLC